MVQQTINRGAAPGDSSGEILYDAFGKVNNNFTELYDKRLAIDPRIMTGAVGDGVADDTSALQQAISLASILTNGATVLISGVYKISSTIELLPKVTLLFAGTGARITSSADITMINVRNKTSIIGNGGAVENTAASWNGALLRFSGEYFYHRRDELNTYRDLRLKGYGTPTDANSVRGTGILLECDASGEYIQWLRFNSINISDCWTAIHLYAHNAGGTVAWINGNYFLDIGMDHVVRGIEIDSNGDSVNNMINGNVFEVNYEAGLTSAQVAGKRRLIYCEGDRNRFEFTCWDVIHTTNGAGLAFEFTNLSSGNLVRHNIAVGAPTTLGNGHIVDRGTLNIFEYWGHSAYMSSVPKRELTIPSWSKSNNFGSITGGLVDDLLAWATERGAIIQDYTGPVGTDAELPRCFQLDATVADWSLAAEQNQGGGPSFTLAFQQNGTSYSDPLPHVAAVGFEADAAILVPYFKVEVATAPDTGAGFTFSTVGMVSNNMQEACVLPFGHRDPVYALRLTFGIAWQPSTSYIIGEIRAGTIGGVVGLYECLNDHTSSAVDMNTDAAKWRQITTYSQTYGIKRIFALSPEAYGKAWLPAKDPKLFSPLRVPEYTISALPSAASYDNGIALVTNDRGGRTLATSDGTNWRRVADGQTLATGTYDGDWINVLRHGVKGDGITDDTAAINALLSAATPSGMALFFPPGTYLITSTLLASKNGIQIIGCGRIATTFKFEPSVSDIMLEFNAGGSSAIKNGSVSGLQVLTTDTSVTKTAFFFRDISGFRVSDILITGFNDGQGSIGLHFQGRDTSGFRDLALGCARPIVFDKNPNHAEGYLDADVFDFHNIGTASVGSPYHGIEFINNAIPYHVTFTGSNVIAGCVSAFKANCLGITGINAHRVQLNDFRHEQATGGGYSFDIQFPNDTNSLYDLLLNNCKAETTQATTDGFRLQGVRQTTMLNCRAYDNSADALNVTTCRSVELINCSLGEGPTNTVTLASDMEWREVRRRVVDTWLPSDGAIFMTRPSNQMALWERYGAKEFARAGTLADAEYLQIPADYGGNTGNPILVEVVVKTATFTEYAKVFDPADGTGPQVLQASANFAQSGGLGIFPTSGLWSVYNTGTATRIYNNLNESGRFSFRILN